ncbi:hypothetical protein AgCh_010427 [Apium graveolens]
MTIIDKKKMLWNKATPVEPKSNLMINQFATLGLRAKQPRERAGLDSDEEKIQTGVEVTLRDPFMLTDKPYEQIKQKHLDKVMSAQIMTDAHNKDDIKEKLTLFLNDGRNYRLADTDVLKKFVKELQHIHYLLEVKSDVTRRWSEYILKAIRDLLRISGFAMKGGRSKAGSKDERLSVKQSKGKKVKDPNKPKRAPSAFFVFMEGFRKQFKEENPNVKGVAAMGKAGGDRWRSMSDDEKAPFVRTAEQRKKEYEKKMRAYESKQSGGNEEEESDKSKSEVNDEEDEEGSEEEEDDD